MPVQRFTVLPTVRRSRGEIKRGKVGQTQEAFDGTISRSGQNAPRFPDPLPTYRSRDGSARRNLYRGSDAGGANAENLESHRDTERLASLDASDDAASLLERRRGPTGAWGEDRLEDA